MLYDFYNINYGYEVAAEAIEYHVYIIPKPVREGGCDVLAEHTRVFTDSEDQETQNNLEIFKKLEQ